LAAQICSRYISQQGRLSDVNLNTRRACFVIFTYTKGFPDTVWQQQQRDLASKAPLNEEDLVHQDPASSSVMLAHGSGLLVHRDGTAIRHGLEFQGWRSKRKAPAVDIGKAEGYELASGL
jgi:hypothetical protein